MLDEASANIDTTSDARLQLVMRQAFRNVTTITVAHRINTIIDSDRVLVLSAPPSRILLDHRVDIPHPRDVFTVRETPAFAHHFGTLWKVLGEQFKQTGVEDLGAAERAA